MSVDASPHLPLIGHVIKQMGLRGSTADEAFSEGLVAITKAAIKYDPGRNVPLANWLAQNIRWGINSWLEKERRINYLIPDQPPAIDDTDNFMDAIEAPENVESSRAAFKEALALMERLLTAQERLILLATAWGYTGVEIAKSLNLSTVQVSVIKTKAQAKLRRQAYAD